MSSLRQLGDLAELVLAIEADLLEIRESLDMHQFCAYWGAHDVMRYVRDCTCVVHGTTGCMTSARFLTAFGAPQACDSAPRYSTALDEHDVIFGGEKKLAVALREVQARHAPALIAVLTNCCADIIGDDVAGVIAAEPTVAAKTVWLHTGGFTGKSYRAGTDAAFARLAALMDRAPGTVRPGTVNVALRRWIWGPTRDAEIAEVTRLLAKLGLQVNRVLQEGMSLDDLLAMRAAEANVSVCAFFASGLFDEMERRFGTKAVHSSSPVGLTQTLAWLADVAAATGRTSHAEADEEVRDLVAMRQRLRGALGEGRHAVIWTQTGDRMIGLARLARDVGLEPVLVGIDAAAVRDKIRLFRQEIDSGFGAMISMASSVEDIRDLVRDLNDPVVFCNDDYFPEHRLFQHRHATKAMYGLTGARLLYAGLADSLRARRSRYSLVSQVVPR